jgi:hypothetical protein
MPKPAPLKFELGTINDEEQLGGNLNNASQGARSKSSRTMEKELSMEL